MSPAAEPIWMERKMARLLMIAILCWLAWNSPVGAQTADRTAPLNTVPSASEVLGSVPNHFFWLRPNLQAVQDPVDGALVFLDDAGRVLGRVGVPAGFHGGKVVPETDQVRMIDESGNRQVIVLRTIDPATTDRLEASEVPGLRASVAPLSRTGPKRLTLGQGLRSGERPIQLRSSFGGILADAYDIGRDAQNNRYVVTEEIVSSKPSLKVRVSVQRFDRSGKLTGRASVPIEQMDVVPRGFATVTDAGVLRILVPKQNGVIIQELPFQNLGPRSSAPRSAGVASRQVPIDTNVIAPDGAGNFTTP
jgi:hypothetical protein